MKIYLCGPINGCSDAEANGWRERAIALAVLNGAECINPMSRDFRGIEGDHTAEIVNGDLADIDSCDVFLRYFERSSEGSAMEQFYAHRAGKKVIVVDKSNKPISPWMKFHSSHIFDCIERAMLEVFS